MDVIRALNTLDVGAKVVGATVVATIFVRFALAPLVKAWRGR